MTARAGRRCASPFRLPLCGSHLPSRGGFGVRKLPAMGEAMDDKAAAVGAYGIPIGHISAPYGKCTKPYGRALPAWRKARNQPSLRAKRGNPAANGQGSLDCHGGCASSQRRRAGRWWMIAGMQPSLRAKRGNPADNRRSVWIATEAAPPRKDGGPGDGG